MTVYTVISYITITSLDLGNVPFVLLHYVRGHSNYNKKLLYCEEHSESVVLSWCTV